MFQPEANFPQPTYIYIKTYFDVKVKQIINLFYIFFVILLFIVMLTPAFAVKLWSGAPRVAAVYISAVYRGVIIDVKCNKLGV